METPAFEVDHWVAASAEDVFDFFCVPEKMVQWHGVEAQLDPRPGGIWRVRHANGAVLKGEFVEVHRPERVVFTWGFETPPPELVSDSAQEGTTGPGASRVEVTLVQEREGTRIRLRHSGFALGEPVAMGWKYFLRLLAEQVAR